MLARYSLGEAVASGFASCSLGEAAASAAWQHSFNSQQATLLGPSAIFLFITLNCSTDKHSLTFHLTQTLNGYIALQTSLCTSNSINLFH